MDEPHRDREVGSVADEAARLVAALLARVPADAHADEDHDDGHVAPPGMGPGWGVHLDGYAGYAPETSRSAHPAGNGQSRQATPDDTISPGDAGPTTGARPGPSSNGARAGSEGEASRRGVCPTCGGTAGARSTCSVCPVCQLIDLVRAVSPQALDRLADVTAVLSEGLRGLADAARSGSGPFGHDPGRGRGNG